VLSVELYPYWTYEASKSSALANLQVLQENDGASLKSRTLMDTRSSKHWHTALRSPACHSKSWDMEQFSVRYLVLQTRFVTIVTSRRPTSKLARSMFC
jgi:hypothetical protein